MRSNHRLTSRLRSRVTACVGIGAIVLLIALNMLVTALVPTGGLYVDMTYEELYTPSELLLETCETALQTTDVDGKRPTVEAMFLSDPDVLMNSLTSRVTYLMMLQLQRRCDNFTVRTVDLRNDPTAVSAFKTTSMTSIEPTDVILVSGDKHRVLSLESFWTANSAQGGYYAYSGEYRFACALYSLLAVGRPTAYFLTGHGETVYETDPDGDRSGNEKTAALYGLLLDCGMEVRTLDLSTVTAVPDDCVLLIINDPRRDYVDADADLNSLSYVSELEKIDRYLVERQGALMVAKDYALTLTELEVFLREWGFIFNGAQLQDTVHFAENKNGDNTHILVEYDTAEDSYGTSIFGEISSLSSAAATVVPNTGYLTTSFRNDGSRYEDGSSVKRVFAPLLTSYSTARAMGYNADKGAYTDPVTDKSAHVMAATGCRISTDPYTANKTYSYVFCTASADFFATENLGRASYANYDVTSLLVENISRVDVYASEDLGGSTLNSKNSYGKVLISEGMVNTSGEVVYAADGSRIKALAALTPAVRIVLTVLVIALPVALCVVGAVILVRRRFL